jgi:hypothetical protein
MGLDSPDHTKSSPSGSGFFYTTSFVIATGNENLARRAKSDGSPDNGQREMSGRIVSGNIMI